MDNKYQDLHIGNYKNHSKSVMREIQIKKIIFTETEIFIYFIKDANYMCLIFDKKYNQITID